MTDFRRWRGFRPGRRVVRALAAAFAGIRIRGERESHRPAEERGKAACRVRPGRGEAPGTARKGWFISLFLGRPAHDKCASGGKPSWARFPAPMPPQKNQLHSLPQDSGLNQRTNRAMEAVSTTATPMPHMALPSMIEEREEDKRAGSPAPKGQEGGEGDSGPQPRDDEARNQLHGGVSVQTGRADKAHGVGGKASFLPRERLTTPMQTACR